MHQSRGSIGHSKHRQAFKPGGKRSKGGPVSKWQKFLRMREANQPKLKPRDDMRGTIAEVFNERS